MKLVFKDDNIILYLNKLYTYNIDFNNKEVLNKYIKNLLHKLEKNYGFDFNGYYNINIYLDKNYGVIMEIIGEDSLYVDYFGNTLDVNIKVYKDSFLYEVSDININDDCDVYVFDNRIYISFKKIISNESMVKFIESVNDIVYGKNKRRILRGQKVLG